MSGRAILAVLIAVTLVTGIILAVADGDRSADVPSATPTDEDIVNSPDGSPGTTDASPFGTTTPSPLATSPGTSPATGGGTPTAGASPTPAGTGTPIGGQPSPTSGVSPAGGQASPAPSPSPVASPSPVVSPGVAGTESTGVAVTGPPALAGAAGLIPLLAGLFLFRRIRRPQA